MTETGSSCWNFENPYAVAAARMVRRQIQARGLQDPRVLDAMGTVPRHVFVSDIDPQQAYADHPLPTADGQTISQPYIVAAMTELLDVKPGQKVLEVGTGSGYQTAILAYLGGDVTSIERNPELASRARQNLAGLGLDDRVQIVIGDGSLGWPQGAPYDRILVTAAAPDLPTSLRSQLADGGRIVIPIGGRRTQHLHTYVRSGDRWSKHRSIGCVFVPLIGNEGWPNARDVRGRE